MDKQLEVQLRRLISMAVKAKEIESDDVQSRRIPGQFGGEVWSKVISDIVVLLEYNPNQDDFEGICDIISRTIGICKSSYGNVLYQKLKVFLFNSQTCELKLLKINFKCCDDQNKKLFLKEIEEFENKVDVKTIERMAVALRTVKDTTLIVFITGKNGCDCGQGIPKRVQRQSIWIRLNKEKILLQSGIPSIINTEVKANI